MKETSQFLLSQSLLYVVSMIREYMHIMLLPLEIDSYEFV